MACQILLEKAKRPNWLNTYFKGSNKEPKILPMSLLCKASNFLNQFEPWRLRKWKPDIKKRRLWPRGTNCNILLMMSNTAAAPIRQPSLSTQIYDFSPRALAAFKGILFSDVLFYYSLANATAQRG